MINLAHIESLNLPHQRVSAATLKVLFLENATYHSFQPPAASASTKVFGFCFIPIVYLKVKQTYTQTK